MSVHLEICVDTIVILKKFKYQNKVQYKTLERKQGLSQNLPWKINIEDVKTYRT